MKIVSRAVLTANLDDIYLTVEGIQWQLIDIMPILNKITCTSNVVGDASWNVYMDCPFTVQAVGSAAGAGTLQVLTNTDPVWVRNLQTVATLAQFAGGRNYLLQHIDGPVTSIIPQPVTFATALNTGIQVGVISSRRYLYNSPTTDMPIGAVSVNAISFDVDLAVYNAVKGMKDVAKLADASASNVANLLSGQNSLLTK